MDIFSYAPPMRLHTVQEKSREIKRAVRYAGFGAARGFLPRQPVEPVAEARNRRDAWMDKASLPGIVCMPAYARNKLGAHE